MGKSKNINGNKGTRKAILGAALGISMGICLMLNGVSVKADGPENPGNDGKVYVGDVDGDGQITPKDVTVMRRSLAGGWGVEVSPVDGDVDGDGQITPKDVTLLRRYLAGGWGVTLPEKIIEAPLEDVAINETNFPDEIFRGFVTEYYDLDHDGILNNEEIRAVNYLGCGPSTYAYDQLGINREDYGDDEEQYVKDLDTAERNFYFAGNGIKNLKGVEYFVDVEEIICWYNQIEKLDLSNNQRLKRLSCSYNALTSLNISQNTDLEYLNCKNNKLTELNVSNNKQIESIYCENNNITELDLNNNTELKFLSVYGNPITTLDLRLTKVNEGGFGPATGLTAIYKDSEVTFGEDGMLIRLAQVDQDGNIIAELYDIVYAEGHIVAAKEKDAEGKIKSYELSYYPSGARLSEVCTEPDGRKEYTEWYENGNRLKDGHENTDGKSGSYEEYDEEGNRTKGGWYDADGSSAEYTYDADGHKDIEIHKNSKGIVDYTRSNYKYDDAGREIGFTEVNESNETYTVVITYYTDEGYEDKRLTETWTCTDGRERYYEFYKNEKWSKECWTELDGHTVEKLYNEEGIVLSEVHTFSDGTKEYWSFDDKGTREKIVRKLANRETEWTRTDYVFDEDGNEIEFNEVNSDNNIFHYTITYYPVTDEQDWAQMASEKRVGSDGSEWGADHYQNGKWSKEWWKNPDGNEGWKTFREDGSRSAEYYKDADGRTGEWTCDQHGNNVTYVEKNADGDIVEDLHWEIQYDEKGRKKQEVEKDSEENVCYTRTEYEYNEYDAEIGYKGVDDKGIEYIYTITYYPLGTDGRDDLIMATQEFVASNGEKWKATYYTNDVMSWEQWLFEDGSSWECTYRGDGSWKEDKYIDKDGTTDYATYNELSKNLTWIRTDADGNILESRTYAYEYDESGNLTKEMWTGIDGSYWSKEYNADGGWTEYNIKADGTGDKRIFNKDGLLLQTYIIKPEE